MAHAGAVLPCDVFTVDSVLLRGLHLGEVGLRAHPGWGYERSRGELLRLKATVFASGSQRFGSWSSNLMTEWHVRYGGPGVMIYLPSVAPPEPIITCMPVFVSSADMIAPATSPSETRRILLASGVAASQPVGAKDT